MKKTNKGFSMVELIIVIAIMAILAGALAPALIRYINKSRLSTDIQTANTIATAAQTAIATEAGYDAAVASYTNGVPLASVYTLTDACASQIKMTCGTQAPKLKAKKCNTKSSNGTACAHNNAYGGDFKVKIDPDNNVVVVTETTGSHELYPNAEGCVAD